MFSLYIKVPMKKSLLFTLFIFQTFFSFNTSAQPGSIDLSFNATDLGFGYGDGPDGLVYSSVALNNGKAIIVGQFLHYNGSTSHEIVGLNADGTLDNSFNVGSGADNIISAVAVQSDGKILIGGQFTNYNGALAYHIARLNADGTIDNAFKNTIATGTNGTVSSLVIQADGKIVIMGLFTTFNGTARKNIARLNSDGSLDAAFDAGTASTGMNCLAVQADGKIIVGGTFISFNGTTCKNLIRLNTNGSVDLTYNMGTGPGGNIYSMAMQADGKLLIGGNLTSYNGTSQNCIARLNTDGTLDTGFNSGSVATGSTVCITVQSNGKILIARQYALSGGPTTNAIERLNTDGSLDVGFNTGTGASDRVQTMSVQPDGKIILGGKFTSINGASRNYLDRLNADGSEDAAYNPGTGANDRVECIVVQPDGKILIGGLFTRVNGHTRNGIARLNSDGSLDLSFDPGLGAKGYISCVALQPDGKILIGGEFNTFNGAGYYNIARLNANGSVDATFSSTSSPDFTVLSIVIQTDGKILIGGQFTSINGFSRNRIARLNADGTLDTGFTVGTAFGGGTVYSIVLQPDGKVLAAGVFSSYNGTAENVVARLNTDGTVDAGFNAGTFGGANILTIILQADGKIILGGQFTSLNGSTSKNIVRLNSDGSLDTGFNAGTGPDNKVMASAMQGDGKILIAGMLLTSYNGTTMKSIARINADGTLDTGFNSGTGTSNTYTNYDIHAVAIQNDGSILIGGSFTSYNGTGRNRIARINGGAGTPTGINVGTIDNNMSVYPNPFNGSIAISNPENVLKAEIFNSLGELVYVNYNPDKDIQIINTQKLSNGIYLFVLTTDKGKFSSRLIKE
jgi:uncharacterized delta-60 repeat protein